MTIVEFLTARLDEDEEAARMQDGYAIEWYVAFGADRIRADIAAKRAIVDRYIDAKAWTNAGHYDEYATEAPGLETAVSLLAMPYSEHPDYQQEWKP